MRCAKDGNHRTTETDARAALPRGLPKTAMNGRAGRSLSDVIPAKAGAQAVTRSAQSSLSRRGRKRFCFRRNA